MGASTHTCLGCSYCRVQGEEYNITKFPTDLNPAFDTVPVAVNLLYGDPMIQIESTLKILEGLEQRNHKGPVLIVTKGDLTKFPKREFKLDLHIAFSTFGLTHEYDKNSYNNLISNLEYFNKMGFKYRKSLEFRPICNGINDSDEVLDEVFQIARKYDLAIGYSGLQGKPEHAKYWADNNINFKPYPGFKFGHKKSISDEVQAKIIFRSKLYHVPVFSKTSCLISYTHGLERDYNSHYYRPSEMGCTECPMEKTCFDFKNSQTTDKSKFEDIIPFDFEIIKKEKHECILKTKKICEFPSPDCSNINGHIIKINEKLTTADVRMIKWLTGFTVDADFHESHLLNKKFIKY